MQLVAVSGQHFPSFSARLSRDLLHGPRHGRRCRSRRVDPLDERRSMARGTHRPSGGRRGTSKCLTGSRWKTRCTCLPGMATCWRRTTSISTRLRMNLCHGRLRTGHVPVRIAPATMGLDDSSPIHLGRWRGFPISNVMTRSSLRPTPFWMLSKVGASRLAHCRKPSQTLRANLAVLASVDDGSWKRTGVA